MPDFFADASLREFEMTADVNQDTSTGLLPGEAPFSMAAALSSSDLTAFKTFSHYEDALVELYPDALDAEPGLSFGEWVKRNPFTVPSVVVEQGLAA